MYAALAGPHRWLAEWDGRVARYPVDVAPFVGLPDSLAAQRILPVVQMTAPPLTDGEPAIDDAVVRLGVADVPEMLDLAERTEPGPFRPRTIELGTYLGIRHEGRLLAMAGERFRVPGGRRSARCVPTRRRAAKAWPAGWSPSWALEATCGDGAFLHVLASNTDAIRLYETLGFASRAEFFIVVVAPSQT